MPSLPGDYISPQRPSAHSIFFLSVITSSIALLLHSIISTIYQLLLLLQRFSESHQHLPARELQAINQPQLL
jgi:hypothetical protein